MVPLKELILTILAVVVPFYTMLMLVLWRYRPNRGSDRTADAGVSRLIDDIRQAHRTVVVMCKSCSMWDASDEKVRELTDLLREKAQEGVNIHVVTVDDPPRFLRDLAAERFTRPMGGGQRYILKIQQVPGPLPWTGRVVDGAIVERHPDGELLFARGEYARSTNARDIADELNQVLAMATH